MAIGKLEEVDIRELWKHEQYDFSEWLSKKENIENLNDILGLTLVDISKETYVGSYRCDLFAKDETTGIKVIIENQLEMSNHDHLGKIITYASGLDAKVVVWIVKEAREEHRSAIEWLNNNTNSNINFFLIEIHAYKIGNSDNAPMFQVIEQPNDFIKNNKSINSNDTMSKSQSQRLEFWNQFNNVLVERGKPFNVRKATTDHWYNVAIGTSDAHIDITLVNKDSVIGVELYITDNKEFFDKPYTDYVDSLHNRLPQPYTLQRNISSFLRDYLGYYNSMFSTAITLSNIEVLRYLDQKQIHSLNKQQKEDLLAYEHAIDLSILGRHYGKDSLEIDSLALPYKEGMLRTNELLNDSSILHLCQQYQSLIPFLMDKKRIDE